MRKIILVDEEFINELKLLKKKYPQLRNKDLIEITKYIKPTLKNEFKKSLKIMKKALEVE